MTDFPVYVKYANGSSFFRIESNECLTEIQCVGSKLFVYRLDAKAYPEKLMIREMLTGIREGIVPATAAEFNALMDKHHQSLR